MRPSSIFAALSLALVGCAGPSSYPIPAVTDVVATTEQGGKFLSFVGPRRQFAEPFLGVPDTNYDLLRTFIDTRNGERAEQLFVENSYFGKEREWNAARDGQGQALKFVPVSKNEITCQAECSYAEEFAAVLPDAVLRGSPQGVSVTFAAKSGETLKIAVPGEAIKKQLAAVDSALAAQPVAPPPK
ncbi:MAG: hypothetical protein JO001_22210 [Alphaproteobacteria bacterium]|nr:hypothetical protein [Alphaproteobacteria bacterium]